MALSIPVLIEPVAFNVSTALRQISRKEGVPQGHRTALTACFKASGVYSTTHVRTVKVRTGSGIIYNCSAANYLFFITADTALSTKLLPGTFSLPHPCLQCSNCTGELHNNLIHPFLYGYSRKLQLPRADTVFRNPDHAEKQA